MAIPLVWIVGSAILGGGLWGGYEAGSRIGNATAKMMPLVGVSAVALMAYKASKK